MSRIYKHIIKITLLIAGVILLAHAFIPHDHHYGFTSDIEHHYNNTNDNSGEAPIHCQFFNNIEVVDYIAQNNFINVLRELPTLFINTFSAFFDTDINYQVNNLIETNDNLPDYCVLISISPTRGSPLI